MRTILSGNDVDALQVGVRLPRALRDQLERVAIEHQSSMSGAMRYLLRRGLEQLDHELMTTRQTASSHAPRPAA